MHHLLVLPWMLDYCTLQSQSPISLSFTPTLGKAMQLHFLHILFLIHSLTELIICVDFVDLWILMGSVAKGT